MRRPQPLLVSLVVGRGVGVIHGLVSVRSPALPIIALLGLLGILVGGPLFSGSRATRASCSRSCTRRPSRLPFGMAPRGTPGRVRSIRRRRRLRVTGSAQATCAINAPERIASLQTGDLIRCDAGRRRRARRDHRALAGGVTAIGSRRRVRRPVQRRSRSRSRSSFARSNHGRVHA
jgi:XapX domain-containing protein